jgi:hypothetical protein
MMEIIHFSKILVTVCQTMQYAASHKKTPIAWGQTAIFTLWHHPMLKRADETVRVTGPTAKTGITSFRL